VRLQQHRNIEVGGATLECTVYGSGTPVVLLANAGCSSGYFEDLARVYAKELVDQLFGLAAPDVERNTCGSASRHFLSLTFCCAENRR
jgi:pimeloyl-ACP methyl ester carboxylesterase